MPLRSHEFQSTFLAFYDARGTIIVQFPHHGIEERQHERNCGNADALDEDKDHVGNRAPGVPNSPYVDSMVMDGLAGR